MATIPTLGPITRRNGVAGQVAYDVTYRYPNERPVRASFVGSVYGAPGPIAFASEPHGVMYVREPERFGEVFGPSWVRRYFGQES